MSTHEGDTQGGGGDGWLRASWRPESNEAELVQPHSAGQKAASTRHGLSPGPLYP